MKSKVKSEEGHTTKMSGRKQAMQLCLGCKKLIGILKASALSNVQSQHLISGKTKNGKHLI